jgi:hypothetical protein
LLPRSGAGKRERALRDLYLELLIKILTNIIYGDPPIDPGRTQFDPALRRAGHGWSAQAHVMVGLARLNNLREAACDYSVAG